MKHTSLSLLIGIGLLACGPSSSNGHGPVTANGSDSAIQAPAITPPSPASTATASEDPLPASHGTSAVDASNQLGFDLYRRLQREPGNLALGPASISLALAMTFAGARGETAAQMRRVLHLPEDASAVHGQWATVLQGWRPQRPNEPVIRVANRLFGEQTLPFDDPFVALTADSYGAPLQLADFQHDPEGERIRINGWVSDQTRDKIRDLLPPGSINPLMRLVLTNAMYFKGTWRQPFASEDTTQADFSNADGRAVPVPMMTQVGHLPHGQTDDAQILELAYQGGHFSAVFVLPKPGQELSSLEDALSTDTMTRWTSALKPTMVRVQLPRFEVEPAESIRLKEHLSALGMPLAFDEVAADFTGMTTHQHLLIDNAYHKAFVAMNESGTEAAAATAVVMREESAAPEPDVIFQADRPFLFFIRDVDRDAVLFVGRVAQLPAAS